MSSEKPTLRSISRSVGDNYFETTEIFRRIKKALVDGDGSTQIVVKGFGTFYLQTRKATTKTLLGVTYSVPSRKVIKLRPH